MEASLILNPASQLDALQLVVSTLQKADEQWLTAAKIAGLDPPCCPACAEPPWTLPGGMRYTPWHISEMGERRIYLDGPAMFQHGYGTCADLAAYAAAAHVVLHGNDARVRVYQNGAPGNYHAVVDIYKRRRLDRTIDPSSEIQKRETARTGASCDCG